MPRIRERERSGDWSGCKIEWERREDGRKEKEKEESRKEEREIKHGVGHVNYTIFTIGFI